MLDAKSCFTSDKHVFVLVFQSLMTGLMYYRPDDHITYLQECLRKVKEQGVETVRWNLFIEQRRKTPLPPISSDGRLSRLNRENSFVTGW